MTVKYLDPYKDDKYGKLRGDKSEAYFVITFKEAIVHKTDDAYIIAGYVTDYKGITRSFKPELPLAPGLCAVPIYGKEYEIRKKDKDSNWISEKIVPSLFEKALYREISVDEDNWLPHNAAVSLKLTHIPNGMCTGKNEAEIATFVCGNVELNQVDLSGELPDYTPPSNSFKGKGGGKSWGMSSAQRLDFIKKQLELEFECFCPKIFSSITPLHLDDRFRELKRRLIVIPCTRVEELSDERKIELNLVDDNWQGELLDLSAYDWKEFDKCFDEFWNLEMAEMFLTIRGMLTKSVKGLSSQQRAISLDLLATGITSGIWEDENVAIERIKAYWKWFKQETEKNAGLGGLLKDYIRQEETNAKNGGRPLQIHTHELRSRVDNWVTQGWLFEKPKSAQVKEMMLDLGMRLQQGIWNKN